MLSTIKFPCEEIFEKIVLSEGSIPEFPLGLLSDPETNCPSSFYIDHKTHTELQQDYVRIPFTSFRGYGDTKEESYLDLLLQKEKARLKLLNYAGDSSKNGLKTRLVPSAWVFKTNYTCFDILVYQNDICVEVVREDVYLPQFLYRQNKWICGHDIGLCILDSRYVYKRYNRRL